METEGKFNKLSSTHTYDVYNNEVMGKQFEPQCVCAL